MISLASSTILRFIDELNGLDGADQKIAEIKGELAKLKREDHSTKNRNQIRRLYGELDQLQYKSDYLSLVIDKETDYWRACKGFKVNEIEYVRLLGTNGGIKNSTIVFVSKRLYPELKRRIENGRDITKPLVPAKLEAYQALVCSGSDPVSMPRGIAVVDDCVTQFTSDIIELSNSGEGEPTMRYIENATVELDESDGYGIMLPSLAERWSEDLNLSYTMCACNTRLSYEKGMVFTFDFLDFADNVAGTRTITDAWGDTVDLSNVELILTTSMVKLWDSYSSCDDYLQNCAENKYTFAITKTAPEFLESQRTLNYQYIQPYNLTDDEIDELIRPTINELHDILRLDWKKAVLFLRGTRVRAETLERMDGDFAKALMINPDVLNDSFVRKKIYELIYRRIQNAKIGVVNVHGNYSIISGDPYALCQSMFGLPVTGLLKSGELYNKYWMDAGVAKVACFRAPMSCANNIRRMNVSHSEEAQYWYQYITTCTILNAWDTTTHALNGADKDGDLVMLTDNRVLVECMEELPALMCVQRKADKKVPTEEDIIKSNIDSFGNAIGKITNRITSMFELQAGFPQDSREYQTLAYRIMCGQLFQQDEIDKAKGIISKPMPKYWYDRSTIWHDESMPKEEQDFQDRIVANKKPYFMRYVYPSVMKQYNKYIKNTTKKAYRLFGRSIDELCESQELSADESEFLNYYYRLMPVGLGDSVMNKICRVFEQEFDGYVKRYKDETTFDYRLLKCGSEYAARQYKQILLLFDDYLKKTEEFTRRVYHERLSFDDSVGARKAMIHEFRIACYGVCSNKYTLGDILIDICYQREGSKQFCWDIVGDVICENLLMKNGGVINYPSLNKHGEIEYHGERFEFCQKSMNGVGYEYYYE